MSEWEDTKNRILPTLVVKQREIPRQVISENEARSIETSGDTVYKTMLTAGFINLIAMFVVTASLKTLWGVLNSQQVIIQLTLI